MSRIDGRAGDQLRPIEIIPNINTFAEGSCLIRCGSTHVLCCASVEEGAPRHVPEGEGWVTAGALPVGPGQHGILGGDRRHRGGRAHAGPVL